MKFEVHATITEVYTVEANSFDEALQIASDMTAPTYTNSDGFNYVLNTEDGTDLIL